jgi:hypothetical protein
MAALHRNEWRLGIEVRSFGATRLQVGKELWKDVLPKGHPLAPFLTRFVERMGLPPVDQPTMFTACRAHDRPLEAHLLCTHESYYRYRSVLRTLSTPKILSAVLTDTGTSTSTSTSTDTKTNKKAVDLVLEYATLECAETKDPMVLRVPMVAYDAARQAIAYEAHQPRPHKLLEPWPLPEFTKSIGTKEVAARRRPLPTCDPIPASLWTSLFEFQKYGVAHVAARGRAWIVDEMGLGKTLQGMACAYLWPEHWPVLTVCPSAMLASWQMEWVDKAGLRKEEVIVVESTEHAMYIREQMERLRPHSLSSAASASASVAPSLQTREEKRAEKKSKSKSKSKGKSETKNESKHSTEKKAEKTKRKRDDSTGKSKPKKKKKYETAFVMPKVVIVSVNLVGAQSTQVFEWLREAAFGVLLLDESQYIKNGDSNRSMRMLALCSAAKHVVLLTGTPGNLPMNLYFQSRAINSRFWLTEDGDGYWYPPKKTRFGQEKMRAINQNPNEIKYSFGQRYCDPVLEMVGGGHRMQWIMRRGGTRLEELHAILTAFFMVRRAKHEVDEVQLQIPPKHRYRIQIKPPNDLRTSLEQQQTAIAQLRGVQEDEYRRQMMAASAQLVAYKLPYIKQVLEEVAVPKLCENPKLKQLWFAHNKVVVKELEQEAKRHGFTYTTIDGEKTQKERAAALQAFQKDPKTRVIVLSISAAGVGLTLTAGSEAYMFQMLWDDAPMLQAEDRIYRIGQQLVTHIYYVWVEGSMDTTVWAALARKAKQTTIMLHGEALDESRFGGKLVKVIEGAEADPDHDPSVLAPALAPMPLDDDDVSRL